MEFAMPLNGPVFINGYFGDAVFRTGQGISTISLRLKEGLEIQEEVIDGCREKFVVPMIRMGDNGHEFQFPMRIYENEAANLGLIYVCPSSGADPAPYEVILGIDFFENMKVAIDCGAGKITSPLFGTVSGGSMRKFSRKNFQSTNYERDIDGRVILLFDMDCFEVQVHEQPHQRGKPRVVINSSDRVLAVSYEAKQLGINRQTTPYLQQALAKYPDLIAIKVPIRNQDINQARPRPDTSVAREATARIVNAIKRSVPEGSIFQFSSGDEFYVDITQYVNKRQKEAELIRQMDGLWSNTFLYNGQVIGQPIPDYVQQRLRTLGKKLSSLEKQELRLIYGSCVASTVVKEILKQTTYQSSVGIGSKKLIAKIASGMHKPGSITILAPSGLKKFSSFVKIEDIPGLGGKLGVDIKSYFQANTMKDLQSVPYQNLIGLAGEKKALEVLNWAFGVDDESVEPTDFFKTSGTTRRLYGDNYSLEEFQIILSEQIDETLEKLEYEKVQNSRIPTKIKLSIRINNSDNLHSTVMLENRKALPKPEVLFKKFCDPPFPLWNVNWAVENLQIVAHF